MKFWKDDRVLPDCCTPQGCPIEDIAQDEYVNWFVDQYLIAKSLFRATEDVEVARPIFRELGLYDDQQFHLALEAIYATWLKLEIKKKQAGG